MIEAGGAIQLRDDGGQLDAETPLVGAAAGANDRLAPSVPPRGDESGERFDHQHVLVVDGLVDEFRQQPLARTIIVDLVDRERCDNSGGWRYGRMGQVVPARTPGEPELA